MPTGNSSEYIAVGATNNMIFTYWVTSATTTTTDTFTTSQSTAANSTVWQIWCNEIVPGTNTYRVPELTEAQKAEQAATRERYRLEELERKRIQAEADARAEELLLANLSYAQKNEYKQTQSFTVIGTKDRRFRVRKGRVGNVDVIDARGIIVDRLCAHPSDGVPDCDTMLAQKLVLEHDDDFFMRVANRHGYSGSREPILQPLH